ncbi:hypothetical protein [Apibacter adventoris]|uniref:Uncharacterized protein n=1 Tax=Apibacter adventoris TaxID=1679466 RepID=A0A2S8AFN6_9FLAO|nr:hypothetical protein [Apibacter adventoris]PQL95009.1 hypothetical protein C4S77_02000 [Apibacter adventoris]
MYKKIGILILILTCVSCQNKISNQGSDEITLKNARKYLNEYFTLSEEQEKKELLSKSYKELNKNEDFKKNGLTKSNFSLAITILIYMKKYDDLERLLLKARNIPDSYNNTIVLNYVKYLKYYKKDKILSEGFIRNNVSLIHQQIGKTPEDSLLYFDYFRMKAYLNGKDKAIKEIDSMKKVNNNFSDFFYDYGLIQGIEEMEDSFPQP